MKRLVVLVTVALIPISSAHAVDIPLLCADKVTYQLRISNVINQCLESELSLGEAPIAYSLTAPKTLNSTLEVRFLSAQAAAKKDGVSLQITSGYRTLARQNKLFKDAIKKYGSYKEAARWVSPPEISHHPLGLAIDVNYPNDPKAAKWLEVNGYKFGLCRVFKNEWWHFEGSIAPGWKCPKLLKDARALLQS
jgi:LAS superfamily LD-carboxypeptidase LdcB